MAQSYQKDLHFRRLLALRSNVHPAKAYRSLLWKQDPTASKTFHQENLGSIIPKMSLKFGFNCCSMKLLEEVG